MRWIRIFIVLCFVSACSTSEESPLSLPSAVTTPSQMAQFERGQRAYDRGDYATALMVWRPLAEEQGDPNVQYAVGLAHEHSPGLPANYAEAVRWFRRAAEQGHADAQFQLGLMYMRGQGAQLIGHAAAVDWMRKSAEQGNANGQNGLGFMYQHGLGMVIDHAEAVKWYRKAVRKGLASAQYNLGTMYQHGQGLPADHVKALAYYEMAAAQGEPKAGKDRDALLARMTPQEIASARRMSGECAKKNYKRCAF